MQVTYSYARPSTATLERDGLRMDVAAERSRPPVYLDALVHDSLAYARVMLALHAVVSSDLRPQQRDHSAYQAWVQERYLEELPAELAAHSRLLPVLQQRRAELAARIATVRSDVRKLEAEVRSLRHDFWKAQSAFYAWLAKHAREVLRALDPVVSVHPDGLIFEVFSLDESSYGRVTVPMNRLTAFGDVGFGTTNVDYSQALADEMARVRSYRPAWLRIGAEGVALTTSAGQAVEKKIDLPPTWVRGFLQVQSAASFPGLDLRLSAGTVADILSVLRRARERQSPRSLRFVLAPGEKPSIVVEPWDITLGEPLHRYTGPLAQTVRVWGRRRLFALATLLPHADDVQVRLLGTGMPSYWTVSLGGGHRFDLGLSGWTQNDWARSAHFDLLASTAEASPRDFALAASALGERLRLSPEELAARTGIARPAATAALQRLCQNGRAMYDHVTGVYRWRQLFPSQLNLEQELDDPRTTYARRLVAGNAVHWTGQPEQRGDALRYSATVQGERGGGPLETPPLREGEGEFKVMLEIDSDGRVQYAQCTCSHFRREKLRKGPCAHILATSALASRQVLAEVVHG
jgi:hypothetical protein